MEKQNCGYLLEPNKYFLEPVYTYTIVNSWSKKWKASGFHSHHIDWPRYSENPFNQAWFLQDSYFFFFSMDLKFRLKT